jgi:hypothetical protein
MCLNHIDGHLAEKKRTGLLVAHIVVKINYIMALCSVTSFLHCLIRNRVKTKWRKGSPLLEISTQERLRAILHPVSGFRVQSERHDKFTIHPRLSF